MIRFIGGYVCPGFHDGLSDKSRWAAAVPEYLGQAVPLFMGLGLKGETTTVVPPSLSRATNVVLCRRSVLQSLLGAGFHEGALRLTWSHASPTKYV